MNHNALSELFFLLQQEHISRFTNFRRKKLSVNFNSFTNEFIEQYLSLFIQNYSGKLNAVEQMLNKTGVNVNIKDASGTNVDMKL